VLSIFTDFVYRKNMGPFKVDEKSGKTHASIDSRVSSGMYRRISDALKGEALSSTGCCLEENLGGEFLLYGNVVCDPEFKDENEMEVYDGKSRFCPGSSIGSMWKARAGTYRLDKGKVYYRPYREASDALKERGFKAAMNMPYNKYDYACCLDEDLRDGESGWVVCDESLEFIHRVEGGRKVSVQGKGYICPGDHMVGFESKGLYLEENGETKAYLTKGTSAADAARVIKTLEGSSDTHCCLSDDLSANYAAHGRLVCLPQE
jgi:hypothetical protein